MNSEILKKKVWHKYLLLFAVMLVLSSSALAEIKICNGSGKNMRLARITLQNSSFFALDCGGFGTEGCYSQIHNFSTISSGWCDTFYSGTFGWLYAAIQTQNKDGSWSSPVYKEDKVLLEKGKEGNHSSGIGGYGVCVKDNHYSLIFDRRVKGMLKAVNAETCKTGYSKIPINFFAQEEGRVIYQIDIS